jgi:hypothetical protein
MRYSWPLTGRAEETRVIEAAISDPELAGITICWCAGTETLQIVRGMTEELTFSEGIPVVIGARPVTAACGAPAHLSGAITSRMARNLWSELSVQQSPELLRRLGISPDHWRIQQIPG